MVQFVKFFQNLGSGITIVLLIIKRFLVRLIRVALAESIKVIPHHMLDVSTEEMI